MKPIITLYEREQAPIETLPLVLAAHYGGGFLLPDKAHDNRPYIIANFVETLDGVVSYNQPEQTGGGVISDDNEQDQMVMGLLRATADAVIFGSSSLRDDANHLHIPSFISPNFADEYATLRTHLGKQEQLPISVIMTASGEVNLHDSTFHTLGLRAIIATTAKGYEHLSRQTLPEQTEVRVIESKDTAEHRVSPSDVLALLKRDYGVHVALYEGGPNLLASFLAEHLIDELFLTLAPQLAGRSQDTHRLSLIEGHAYQPENALRATLLSVKQAESHLLLRYGLIQNVVR